MITIKLKCRKCGKPLKGLVEQNGLNITVLPEDCDCETLEYGLKRLENMICDICQKPITGHEYALVERVFMHQTCYPGGQEAYFAKMREKNSVLK